MIHCLMYGESLTLVIDIFFRRLVMISVKMNASSLTPHQSVFAFALSKRKKQKKWITGGKDLIFVIRTASLRDTKLSDIRTEISFLSFWTNYWKRSLPGKYWWNVSTRMVQGTMVFLCFFFRHCPLVLGHRCKFVLVTLPFAARGHFNQSIVFWVSFHIKRLHTSSHPTTFHSSTPPHSTLFQGIKRHSDTKNVS